MFRQVLWEGGGERELRGEVFKTMTFSAWPGGVKWPPYASGSSLLKHAIRTGAQTSIKTVLILTRGRWDFTCEMLFPFARQRLFPPNYVATQKQHNPK